MNDPLQTCVAAVWAMCGGVLMSKGDGAWLFHGAALAFVPPLLTLASRALEIGCLLRRHANGVFWLMWATLLALVMLPCGIVFMVMAESRSDVGCVVGAFIASIAGTWLCSVELALWLLRRDRANYQAQIHQE